MKSRVLYYSKKKKMMKYAQLAAARLQSDKKIDEIPSAYPCDKERVVIIGATLGRSMPTPLRRFCAELSKQRTAYVAFYVDGSEVTLDDLIVQCKAAGTEVIENVLFVKGGSSVPFIGNKITEDEEEAFNKWIDRVVAEVNGEITNDDDEDDDD